MRALTAVLLAFAATCHALRLAMHSSSVVAIQGQLPPMAQLPSVSIIGGGPSGLSAAIMLARRGYTNIRVFERLPEPMQPDDPRWTDFRQERSYCIGISGRGQRALRALDVMGAIEKHSTDVVGRMDWSPESKSGAPREVIYTGKSYTTKVIQRDRLAAILLHELRHNDAYKSRVTVQFNMACQQVDFIKPPPSSQAGGDQESSSSSSSCLLHLTSSDAVGELIIESPFVLGCDGTASALRDAMALASRRVVVKKFDDKNVRVYRTIPLHFPPNRRQDWRTDLNYSARTKSDINIDALPASPSGPMLGVVLFRPWDRRISSLTTGAEARKFFDDVLPMFSAVVRDDDLDRFAKKEDSKLPRFSYTGPALHHQSAALLGDAIHTVKPYFGLGVNCAFEDVLALSECLDKHQDHTAHSLAEYSRRRGAEAAAMVQISKRLDGGFLSFVLPLLVDNFFHKRLPWIFSPNTLGSLQNENLSFRFIQWRKRLDRVMQLGVMGGSLWGASRAAFALFKLLTRALLPGKI